MNGDQVARFVLQEMCDKFCDKTITEQAKQFKVLISLFNLISFALFEILVLSRAQCH